VVGVPLSSAAPTSSISRAITCTTTTRAHSVRQHAGHIQGTFSQGTFSQGTSRAHSVRVERTPVSLLPNCKKHLKKVPSLTQNTTCKHEYLGRRLTRPNDVSQE
jgi:hypothetical protein